MMECGTASLSAISLENEMDAELGTLWEQDLAALRVGEWVQDLAFGSAYMMVAEKASLMGSVWGYVLLPRAHMLQHAELCVQGCL